MENALLFLLNNANYAHWVIFGLFMLAGLNIPISEDLLIIVSGALASTVVPENTWKLFIAVFLGAYISDWVVYGLGRHFGPNLWKLRWFTRMIKIERLEQIKVYYQRYGILTLLIGRFIPFGVRNCLFVTAGIGGMRFWKFLLADGLACLISNTTLFGIAYYCGKNYTSLCQHLRYVNIAIFSVFLIALFTFFWYKKGRSTPSNKEELD